MCGIVGCSGIKNAEKFLIGGLKLLEYRGYDSAGLAIVSNGKIKVVKTKGKVDDLEKLVKRENQTGEVGIAHTRWATHGEPNSANAHPHEATDLVLVHNGIIENYAELKEELVKKGYKFKSQTDTESLVWLIQSFLDCGKSPKEALIAALKKVKGTYAIEVIFKKEPTKVYGARHGSPMALGTDGKTYFIGSDAIALGEVAKKILYMEEGDIVIIDKGEYEIFNLSGKEIKRSWTATENQGKISKGDHEHFMHKEMFEQPEVIAETIRSNVENRKENIYFQNTKVNLRAIDKIHIVACGTSFHAGLVAKYWIERFSPVWVEVEVASEFRYRKPTLKPGGLAMFISQSGETADTIAALRYAKENRQHIVSIVNVPTSTIARESDIVLLTKAGPEVGVASTKAFTAQLTLLAAFALEIARVKKSLPREKHKIYSQMLADCPTLVKEILEQEDRIKKIAEKWIIKSRDALFLGRGYTFPVALEGALKLKEISYIHAEGYSAGELKHGPIALITNKVPVIVLAPNDDLFEKTISNMKEVKARKGNVILVSDRECCEKMKDEVEDCIPMPKSGGFIEPLLYAIPMQLLAYHAAVLMKRNVDQPRNLAKSVTVE